MVVTEYLDVKILEIYTFCQPGHLKGKSLANWYKFSKFADLFRFQIFPAYGIIYSYNYMPMISSLVNPLLYYLLT